MAAVYESDVGWRRQLHHRRSDCWSDGPMKLATASDQRSSTLHVMSDVRFCTALNCRGFL
ncbi:predicted protein [Coccidioides posadasii str. Silveira]|uniref:Predicted protein n=2 Tax=Coccidioides posadasii (strain RMSCC 757 / Silveira) TaxID=443226 RepID=E9DAH3_COCPS|nr:predicted protein [Coccidioides posadasii str. Silveira]